MTVRASAPWFDAWPRGLPRRIHVPRVTLQFLARELLVKRQWLNATRRGHVLACVLSPLIGIGRRWFGYHLVTARRR